MVAALFLSNIVDPSGAFQNFYAPRQRKKGRIVNFGESVGQVVLRVSALQFELNVGSDLTGCQIMNHECRVTLALYRTVV